MRTQVKVYLYRTYRRAASLRRYVLPPKNFFFLCVYPSAPVSVDDLCVLFYFLFVVYKAGLEIGEMILAVNKEPLLGSNYDNVSIVIKVATQKLKEVFFFFLITEEHVFWCYFSCLFYPCLVNCCLVSNVVSFWLDVNHRKYVLLTVSIIDTTHVINAILVA